MDLPPLASTIDPDELDTLVDQSGNTSVLTVTFTYSGYAVTVTGDVVQVEEAATER